MYNSNELLSLLWDMVLLSYVCKHRKEENDLGSVAVVHK